MLFEISRVDLMHVSYFTFQMQTVVISIAVKCFFLYDSSLQMSAIYKQFIISTYIYLLRDFSYSLKNNANYKYIRINAIMLYMQLYPII